MGSIGSGRPANDELVVHEVYGNCAATRDEAGGATDAGSHPPAYGFAAFDSGLLLTPAQLVSNRTALVGEQVERRSALRFQSVEFDGAHPVPARASRRLGGDDRAHTRWGIVWRPHGPATF